jgi:hypothetical protein
MEGRGAVFVRGLEEMKSWGFAGGGRDDREGVIQ